MKKNTWHGWLKGLAGVTAGAALIVAAGCGSNSDNNSSAQAKVRVLHASPDAPAVDAIINSTAIAANAPYKTATAFSSINAGRGTVKVNVAGTSTTVIDRTPDFNAGRSYTIIAANKVAAIEPLIIDDDRSEERRVGKEC